LLCLCSAHALAVQFSSAPTNSFDPTRAPTHAPTHAPSHLPTASLAPTLTTAPTLPTPAPSPSPTTAEPTQTPTLAPTTELVMFSQRLAIGVSFILVVIAYAVHSITKPSELGQRGLDHRLYRIREFRVEKRWGCRYCGFARNLASGAECMQCGTNQLGEAEILPAHTARGFVAEHWAVRAMALGEPATKKGVGDKGAKATTAEGNTSEGRDGEGASGKRKLTWKGAARKASADMSRPRLAGYGEVELAEEERRLVVWLRPDWPYALHHSNHHNSSQVSSGGSHAESDSSGGTSSTSGGSNTSGTSSTSGRRSSATGGLSGSEAFAHHHGRAPAVCAASGAGVAFSGARAGVGGSELPTALALAEVGFLVAERGRSGADLGVALAPSWHGAAASERREEWGTARFRLVGFVEPMSSLPSSARSAYSPFFTPLSSPHPTATRRLRTSCKASTWSGCVPKAAWRRRPGYRPNCFSKSSKRASASSPKKSLGFTTRCAAVKRRTVKLALGVSFY
jgi:hypothetical protein